MKYMYKPFACLCDMKTLIINDIEADAYEFGKKETEYNDDSEEYGCKNMKFVRIPPTPEILSKYQINKKEYSDICDILEAELSFGNCDLCA